ncbi:MULTISPECIES: signal peptide peptidase SppA [Bacillaceae]|uniref:Signal peptide peptidase SppA n=1 Tax=Evansella alkalicola TaxID=745819 RepID=A0ABS6JSA6_9BACI|nr:MULTISPECIES: signal peptide peptidase SppA [Bacillaceae]MBU9721117.1 signal peptide peptidase SppA [Bacillus alkalicola]
MSTKRWLAVLVAAALFLTSSAVTLFSSIFSTSLDELFSLPDQAFEENVIERGNGRGKIAVIHLNGVITSGGDAPSLLQAGGYNHENFLGQLDAAAEDGDVHGIIIRVNTPGGGVVESHEIHDKIVDIRETYRKNVYISMGSMAASGGYYIAAPADKIYANPQTLTGSIGVIMESINFSELANELGIHSEVIKSGPYKDIMSSTREMTDDEREILQELIDDSYEQFVDVIEAGRELTRNEVYELADGRIYNGNQALESGLIDGTGHLQDVIDVLKEDIGRGDLDVIEYKANMGFPSLFSFAADRVFKNDAALYDIKELMRQNHGPQLLYLYTN